MIADLVTVERTRRCGWGLFAREPIPAGTVIDYRCARCRVVCSHEALQREPPERREALLEHTYGTPAGELVLDCSVGRYMNHRCRPNVLEAPAGFDVAVEPIAAGEELACDYRQFHEPGGAAFDCACGAPGCAGRIVCLQPAPPALERAWAQRIGAVMGRLRLPRAFVSGIGPEAERFPVAPDADPAELPLAREPGPAASCAPPGAVAGKDPGK